jgi:murein DD-endopeptidase MepM/ murein hydrolase activator NlpD
MINRNIYPVTVELRLESDNLKNRRNMPIRDVVQGRSQKNVIRLEVEDAAKPYRLKTNYSWHMGNIFADHDDRVLYKFPFKRGEKYRLDQGYNGSFSHTGRLRYSLDFYMPEGTAVHAARGGIVIDVEQGFREGGTDEKYRSMANNITILHDDGTMADYSHLKYKGARVEPGQKVRAGQLIGYSGSTGYVTGPHLHFTVKKVVLGGDFESLPVKFTSQKGILDMLQTGEEYMAY